MNSEQFATRIADCLGCYPSDLLQSYYGYGGVQTEMLLIEILNCEPLLVIAILIVCIHVMTGL